jgi:PAS domain S-box-containing protein
MYSSNDLPDRNTASRLGLRFQQASRILALLVVSLGLVAFCGWVLHIPALTYIRPTLQSMKVNTALSFVCLGAALWLARNDDRQRSQRILCLLVVIIAGTTLAEYAFQVKLGIDQFLFRDTRTPSLSAYPGRMAISTAICFLFLGFAIMFLGSKKALAVRHLVVGTSFAFSLVALCGYFYGVKPLYSITSLSTIGVHTSVGLMAVCVAYFLARPNEGVAAIAASDTNAGVVLRRLLPAIVVVPILIGWLMLAGQRAGLYDTSFGVALLVLGSIGCLTILALLTARSTYRLEGERAESAVLLQSREELLKIFVKNVPAGVAMLDCDMRYLQVSDRWCADYGADGTHVLGRSHYDLFPDVPDRWKEAHRRALEGETLRADDDRWDHADGTTTWVRWELRPWKTPTGTVGGLLIFAEDITRRKKIEDALSDMGRKLVQAHEEERTRIARELHDDVNQRIALLSVELGRWIQHLLESGIPVTDQAHKLCLQLSEIGKDVQALSHRLHSSRLDYLGLTVAARGFCREFSEQHNVEVEFIASRVPASIPKETSLSLYRVLQEALQNAVKHSGVRKFKVDLQGTSTGIQLTISDLGVGFNSGNAMLHDGLGLVSMRERLQLVGGDLAIISELGRGTTISARAPFERERKQGLAAG